HAPRILVALRASARRMQHLERDIAWTQAIAGFHNANRHTAVARRRERYTHAGGRALGERGRACDLSHGEAIQERVESVEVVQVRVREKHFIDTTNAAVPQE